MVNQNTKQQAQRVRFADEENITRVCADQPILYDSEKSFMWYNGWELQAFRAQVKALRKHQIVLDESQDSWRGLETWVTRELRIQRRAYIRFVLELQMDHQMMSNIISDPAMLLGARAAQESRSALERALVYAMRDTAEAVQLYRETEEIDSKEVETLFWYHRFSSLSKPVHGGGIAIARTA